VGAVEVQLLGVEVDRVVGEQPPPVDLEDEEVVLEPLEQGGDGGRVDDVLVVDPAQQRRAR